MYDLDYSEFYITNVCNLNCENCNRFNNFYFKGHKLWKTHKQEYAKWANLINIKEIGILGGEPLLNPDFPNWLSGICELWPNSKIRVTTNGTQIGKIKNLYSLLTSVQNQVILEINCHNFDLIHTYIEQAKAVFGTMSYETSAISNVWGLWLSSYNNIKDETWPECSTTEDFYKLPQWIQDECIDVHNIDPEYIKLRDKITVLKNNELEINILPSDCFSNSTLIFESTTKTLSLHKSDPAKAMKICDFKKCHHFIDGKLYKCGPVGILPEFVKQFNVERDSEQEKLIQSYVPASPDWHSQEISSFIDNLKNAVPIDQCSLCPEKSTVKFFKATTDKIKIVQIN